MNMHWLAIHFPDLPLEVYTRALEAETPLAVSQRGKVERILLCNRPALIRGVRPGQQADGEIGTFGAAVGEPGGGQVEGRRPEFHFVSIVRFERNGVGSSPSIVAVVFQGP